MIFKEIAVNTDTFSEYINRPLITDDVYSYRIVLRTSFDLTDCTVKVTARRADGNTVTDFGTVSGKTASYVINSGMYAAEGECFIRMTICSSDGSVLTAKELIFDVIGAIDSGSVVSDDRYPFLESALASLNSIISDGTLSQISGGKLTEIDNSINSITQTLSGKLDYIIASELPDAGESSTGAVYLICRQDGEVYTYDMYICAPASADGTEFSWTKINGGTDASADVLGTVLSSLSLSSSSAVSSSDTVISGMGKLQAQLNEHTQTISKKLTFNIVAELPAVDDPTVNYNEIYLVWTQADDYDSVENPTYNYDMYILTPSYSTGTQPYTWTKLNGISNTDLQALGDSIGDISQLTIDDTQYSSVVSAITAMLGGSGVALAKSGSPLYNTDLSTIYTDGLYGVACDSALSGTYNYPADKSVGSLIAVSSFDGCRQLFIEYKEDGQPDIYTRMSAGSVWGEWSEMSGGADIDSEELSALLESLTSAEPTLVWEHPRSTEILGSRDFDLATVTGCIMYEKFDTDMTFDIIEFPCRVTDSSKTLIFRVYEIAQFPEYLFPSNIAGNLKAEITVSGSSLNLSTGLQTATLDSPVTITAGNICVIGAALETPESDVFKPKYWNSSDDTNVYGGTADIVTSNSTIYVATTDSPHRRGYYCYYNNGDGGWDSRWYIYQGNYYAATFNLKKSSSGGGFGWSALAGYLPSEKIEDNSITISKLADERLTDIALPSRLYAVNGTQINFYYDCMVCDEPENHRFAFTGTSGTMLSDALRISSSVSGQVQTALSVQLYDGRFNLESEKDVTLYSIDPTDSDYAMDAKNILVIGDSIIANGSNSGMATYSLLQKIQSDENAANITMIGTCGSGNNKHEGRAGWTLASFIGSSSPFYYDGAFSFSGYMSANEYTACDYVFFHLGINDVFSLSGTDAVQTKFSQNKAYLDTIISSIHSFDSNIKICLLTPLFPPKSADLALSYPNSSFMKWRYKQRLHYYTCKLISAFDNRTNENIFIVPFGCCIDTENNFPTTEQAVNAYTTQTSNRQNNLHPTDSGYSQIGAAIYSFIRNER